MTIHKNNPLIQWLKLWNKIFFYPQSSVKILTIKPSTVKKAIFLTVKAIRVIESFIGRILLGEFSVHFFAVPVPKFKLSCIIWRFAVASMLTYYDRREKDGIFWQNPKCDFVTILRFSFAVWSRCTIEISNSSHETSQELFFVFNSKISGITKQFSLLHQRHKFPSSQLRKYRGT